MCKPSLAKYFISGSQNPLWCQNITLLSVDLHRLCRSLFVSITLLLYIEPTFLGSLRNSCPITTRRNFLVINNKFASVMLFHATSFAVTQVLVKSFPPVCKKHTPSSVSTPSTSRNSLEFAKSEVQRHEWKLGNFLSLVLSYCTPVYFP